MRREDLPNPARFLRGIPLDKPTRRAGLYESGPPKHPIIKVTDFDEEQVEIVALLHQSAFGPPGGVWAMDKKAGCKRVFGGKPPLLDDMRRYVRYIVPRSYFEALPLCRWSLRVGKVEGIEVVEGLPVVEVDFNFTEDEAA